MLQIYVQCVGLFDGVVWNVGIEWYVNVCSLYEHFCMRVYWCAFVCVYLCVCVCVTVDVCMCMYGSVCLRSFGVRICAHVFFDI